MICALQFPKIFLCFIAFLVLSLPAVAQSPSPADSLAPIRYSPQYMRGQDMARTEAEFPGTFATGLAFGMALPFVAGATGAGAHDITNDSGFFGTAGFFSSAVLWTWGGSRLIQQPGINVPARHHTGLGEQDRIDFDAGYRDIARDKRAAQYGFGVATGIAVSLATVLYIFSHITLGST